MSSNDRDDRDHDHDDDRDCDRDHDHDHDRDCDRDHDHDHDHDGDCDHDHDGDHDHRHRRCPPGTFPHDYQQGETFWKLARLYHTTVEAIERANPHLDPYNLQPGMVICIPKGVHRRCPPRTFPYTIQQGDTFFRLAKRFGTTVAAIEAANPGVDPYNLQPGMVVCIPDS